MDATTTEEGTTVTTKTDKPTRQVQVQVRQESPAAMFLRTVLATGTDSQGKQFELAQGGGLILSRGAYGDTDRTVETLSLDALVRGWLGEQA